MRELPVPGVLLGRSRSGRSGASPMKSARATPCLGRAALDRPAVGGRFRICLLAVDVQNTFCIPEFELFVRGRSGTGAVDDNRRLCEFLYRNLAAITQIVPSLDTHRTMQLFHAVWFVDEEGRPPRSLHARLGRGRRAGTLALNPAAPESLGIDPDVRGAPAHRLHAEARRGRQVPPDDLAVPRASGRHRPRARLARSRRRSSSTGSPARARRTSRSKASIRSPSTTRCSARR